ncbi:MAG TPA: ABC transporter permease [Candidatus Binatia bacterium]|nr:ABC transporter permease [Candidatus Binatia bacterium]
MSIAAWTETLFKDLRYAARQFVRNPVFTAVAVGSLAIGIGANTAIFSVLDAAMLKSLPVRDPGGLVMLTDPDSAGVSSGLMDGERGLLSYAEFAQLRDHLTTFESLCVAQSQMSRLQVRIAGGQQEETHGRLVSEEYFSVLGVDPAMGRFFTRDDGKSPGEDPYAVISYDYWQKRFGGNVSALGTPIKLLGTTLTVIGVAAPGFTGESVGEIPDFWIPMLMQPSVMPGRDWLHEDLSKNLEKVMWLHAFGRLKPGVTNSRAQTEVDVLFKNMIETGYPTTLDPETRKQAMNQHLKLHDARTGAFGGREQFTQQLKVLLGASIVVLLIACINVANLLLARATARSKEVGVRLSIGASRLRLIRQFLTESLVLSLLGGAAGLLLAWTSSRALVLLLSERRDAFVLSGSLDLRVLAFTTGVTVVTGMLFGLVPALRSTSVNLNDSLRDGGRTTASGSKLNLAKGLVIVQVALSLLLVAGAGLFLRTLWNLQSVDLGYTKEHLLLVGVDGISAGYKDARLSSLWHDLTERLRTVPGVQGATYSTNGLFSGSESNDDIEVEGFTPSKNEEKEARFDRVGPQYFSTVGIPMLLGRDIGQEDTAAAPHVCVINEAFAKAFFKGRNPIGHHITQKFGDAKNTMEVVGVARNARDHRLRGDIPPRFYVSGDQAMGGPNGSAVFEVRTAGDPEQMIAAVRKALLSVNEDLPVGSARPVVLSVDRTNAQPRMVARLCSIFGIMALLLAATGLYGVLSYGVARRTNEIGIRMALGAGKGRVIQMILRETGIMIVLGVVAGVVFTAIGVQLIKSALFGLGVLDPLAVLSAVGILTAVAFVAGYIPAARAARVNPTQALRHE